MIEVFEQPFMLTGENVDPRNIDFTFHTQLKVTLNGDQQPVLKEYYMNYDPETGIFSNLAVRSTFTYETQPIARRIEDIEWFTTVGEVAATKQLVKVEA